MTIYLTTQTLKVSCRQSLQYMGILSLLCWSYMESETIHPQYSSAALTLKNPKPKAPNPDHKIIIKISSDEFVWDQSSCSFFMLRLYFWFIPKFRWCHWTMGCCKQQWRIFEPSLSLTLYRLSIWHTPVNFSAPTNRTPENLLTSASRQVESLRFVQLSNNCKFKNLDLYPNNILGGSGRDWALHSVN